VVSNLRISRSTIEHIQEAERFRRSELLIRHIIDASVDAVITLDRDGMIIDWNKTAEFLIGRGGVVLGSIYASGPVGRMGADEAIRQITRRESMRKEQEGTAR